MGHDELIEIMVKRRIGKIDDTAMEIIRREYFLTIYGGELVLMERKVMGK